MNKEVYEQMAKEEEFFWWFKSRRSIISKAIKSLVNKENISILEVGSGTGGNINMLKQFGSLDLFECNDRAIELTKEKYNITPKKACLPSNKIDKKYDLIVILDVLEHIENDKQVLEDLYLRLNKGGKLLITVPAYQWLWSKHDILHEHKRRYTLKSLKSIVPSEFNVIYESYFNFFLSPLIIMSRFFEKILKKESSVNLKSKKTDIVFEKIFEFEKHFVPKVKLPFGISIMLVLERNND